MYDDSGIWHEQTFDQPGGGAATGLDIMNAFTGQKNAQEAAAAQRMKALLSLLSNQNAGAVLDNPDVGTTTGMTTDALQNAYQNTPDSKYRTLYGSMSPDDQSDPTKILSAGIMSGAEKPSAATTASLGMMKENNKMARLQAVLTGKEGKQRMDFVTNGMKQGLAAQTLLDMANTIPTGTLSEDAVSPLAAAKAGELTAKTANTNAKTEEVAPLADSLIAQRAAHTVLIQANTQLASLKTQAQAMTNNGTAPTTPVQKAAMLAKINQIEKNVAAAKTKYLLPSQRKDPNAAGAASEYEAKANASIAEIRNLMGGGQAAAPKLDNSTMAAALAEFKKRAGRDPKPEEAAAMLAKFKELKAGATTAAAQ